MSYAEYGSRIFYNHISDTKLPLGQGDELPDRYSGCRLKKQDSCLDVRAWSLNQLDYCRYFRELAEHEPSPGKLIPNETTTEAVEVKNEEEIENLRRELAKYKSLKLTPEQKKQLGHSDLWEALSKEGWSLFESFLNRIEKIKGYKEVLLERAFPGSFAKIEEIRDDDMKLKQVDNEPRPIKRKLMDECDTGKNTTEPESLTSSNKMETDKNDTNYTSSDQSDNSSDSCVKSKSTTISDEDDDTDNINSIRDSQTETISTDFEHDYIIREKDAEIEKFTNLNTKLKSMLENRDIQIENLHEKLTGMQCQLREMVGQRNFEVDELKMKLSDGKNLIDQLKKKLEEQRLQCNIQMKKIENLRYDTRSMETLRSERDSLASKLDKVLKNVNGIEVHESIEMWICERKALNDENRKLEQQCLELGEEINRLVALNDENNTQRFEMEQIIESLKIEIEEQNKQIDSYKQQLSTLMEESEKTISKYEKSLRQSVTVDENLDQRLGAYLKDKVDNLKAFSCRLDDAWNYVRRRKIEYDNLREQLTESERSFQYKLNEKCEEVKFYCQKYEKCKDLVEYQAVELERLRKKTYSCETDEQHLHLRDTIEKMKLKLIDLETENSDWIDENENLHAQNQKLSDELAILRSDREKLLHEVEIMNMQLDDNEAKIGVFKNENLQLVQTLADTNHKFETMLSQSNSLKLGIDKVNSLSQLQNEIIKDDKEKRKLEEAIVHLRSEHDLYQKKNKRLEDHLINTSNQKLSLEIKVSAIKEDISKLLNDYEVIMRQNNIYSDANLMHLPQKLCESVEALQQRLSLPEILTTSIKESDDQNQTEFENRNQEKTNKKSNVDLTGKIDGNTDDDCDELNSKNSMIISSKEDNHKLSLKLNAERIKHENKLEKLRENKIAYEDHNNIRNHSDYQFSTIDDSHSSQLKTIAYENISIDNKHGNINHCEMYEQSARVSASAHFNHISPILEKNIDDFSKIHEQDNNTAINNCRIFFPHNGSNGLIKSKQRYTQQEFMRLRNTSSHKFIRNCSQRQNHENH